MRFSKRSIRKIPERKNPILKKKNLPNKQAMA
jgi:hypothetical protein